MKRLLTTVFATLLSLIAVAVPLLVGAAVYIMGTNSGTQFAWNQAQGFLPPGLTIETLEGRLSGPLQVENLKYETEYFRLDLKKAEFEWTPSLLFKRRLDIEKLWLSSVHYTQIKPSPPKPQEPSEPVQLPEKIELPVSIRLGQVGLEDLRFVSAPEAEPFVINTAKLQAAARDTNVDVVELVVDSPLFQVEGSTSVMAQGDYPIEGEFRLQAMLPELPEIRGTTSINGDLKNLVIDQSVARPYNTVANVKVIDPLQALAFESVIDVTDLDLQAIKPDSAPVKLTLNLSANGNPESINYALRSQVFEPQIGTLNADASGNFRQQTVSLEQLQITVPDEPAEITARGSVQLDGEQELNIESDWKALQWPLKAEGADILASSPSGKLNVSGTLKNLLTSLNMQLGDVNSPATVKADGNVSLEGEQPDLDITLEWNRLQWPFYGEPQITSPAGNVKMTGTPQDILAKLDVAVGEQGRIDGTAQKDAEVLHVNLDWEQLQWPLNQPQVIAPAGSIQVQGKPDDYILDVQANIDIPEQTSAELVLKGKGTDKSLDLARIDIKALEGTLAGTANVVWQPAVQGSVKLNGQGLNPGELLEGWPGKLNLAINAEGGMENEKPHARLHNLTATGTLRGYNLNLDAQGDYANGVANLEKLAFTSGATSLNASGSVSETLDVDWKLNSDDLGTLLPEASGKINGSGKLSGPLQRPLVVAKLTANALKYAADSVESLNLNADVDVNGERQSTLLLNVENARAAGVDISKVSLKGDGNASSHTLTLLANSSQGDAEISLRGQLANLWQEATEWRFQMDKATLKYPDLDAWSLRAPATGRVSAAQSTLTESCWVSSEASLCLEAAQSQSGTQANFELSDLPFDYFAAFTPEDFTVQGALGGKGRFSQTADGQQVANIDLRTTTTRINSVPVAVGEGKPVNGKQIVEFLPADIQASLNKGAINANVNLPLSETDGFQIQANIPPGAAELTQRPLNGRITSQIQDLGFLADLIPAVQELQGRVEGDMKLAGSIATPVLNGRFALLDGSAKLEGPGLDLKEIQVELAGEGDGAIKLSAQAASGKGRMVVDGKADLRGTSTIADINVKGDNFRVINTLEARVDVSPDLKIAMREDSINVDGEVRVPKTRVDIKELPESATQVSGDQVIVDSSTESQPEEETAGKPLFAKVRLILGDDVKFKGFGLNARFEGDILAIETPGEPTTASGELHIVDGEYKAYGQGLVIERGRVLFAGGPISQPGLDVRAIRRPAEGITVGVQVRGSLNQPDFTLFSEPGMSQGNQLSYLVLGRPLSGSSDEEGNALSRAALALGLKGGSSITGKIGSKLGLDEFGVASGEAGSASNPDQASFVIGKYLSPKLYVSYGLGLFDPVSTVKLQYAISSKWRLVTESSGVASGGDVIYTIETGE